MAPLNTGGRYCAAAGGSDTYANTFSDPKRDSYANGDCNSDTYGYSELHAEVSTHAAAAPHAGTSTVMDAGLATKSFLAKVQAAGFGHGNEVVKP